MIECPFCFLYKYTGFMWNSTIITSEWIPCGNKDLVCILSSGGDKNIVTDKQAVHYGGDW